MYRRAEHILLMEDFVVFRLTGTAQIDYSLATGSCTPHFARWYNLSIIYANKNYNINHERNTNYELIYL